MSESGTEADGAQRLAAVLLVADPSARFQAALTAGTHPDASYLELLIERCAVEPDFYVRDMLTWALTRLPLELVFARLLTELDDERPQARSQALHTLSKLRDARAWAMIRPHHLHDPDTEVARAAWRTAAGLVPYGEERELARELAVELGRGIDTGSAPDLETMRSLSRACVELGEQALAPLQAADDGSASAVARHARATLRLIEDPESTFWLEAE